MMQGFFTKKSSPDHCLLDAGIDGFRNTIAVILKNWKVVEMKERMEKLLTKCMLDDKT